VTKFKTLEVYCKCDNKLFKYLKGGNGRLIKLQKPRIKEDYTKKLLEKYELNTEITCPFCEKRIATVKVIGGKYVYKLNQGQIYIN